MIENKVQLFLPHTVNHGTIILNYITRLEILSIFVYDTAKKLWEDFFYAIYQKFIQT